MSETTAARPGPEAGDELDLRLVRGRRGHGGLVLRVRVLPAAALLGAVQVLLTGTRLARSWFWQDDLNLLATTAHRSLSPSLLLSDYNGHLVPGSWALAWLLDRVAPLQWWPAALLTLAVVAATSAMMLALLRRLFGDRPAILLPYAMFCATSLTLTGTLWWAAALEWLPVTLALVCAFWFHVGLLRTGRRADALGAALSVLLGLLFFEKALVIPVMLALFTVLYAVPGPLWRRPGRALRRLWGYWLALAALGGGFLWLYLSRVTIETGAPSSGNDVLELTRLMILETLLPSLVGGPLHWITTPATTISAWPDPWTALAGLALALALGAVLGSLVLIRGAWRAWLLVLVFVGVSVALVARARLGFIGPFVGRDHRYLTDAAVMVPLGLALAWLPLRDGLDAAVPPAPPTGRRGRLRAGFDAQTARRRAVITALGPLAVLTLTVGGAVSGEQFMHSWSRNPTESYIQNLSAGLAAHAGPVYLFGDEVTPDQVMIPTFLADRQLRRITRPMPVRPVVRAAVPYFSVVDDAGRLHDGMVQGVAVTLRPNTCARTDHPIVVRLPLTPEPGLWKLRIGYLANRQTTARISIGAQPAVPMRLEHGLHEVYVSLPAGGSDQLTLTGLDQDASVCLGGATLGFPVAKP